MPTQEEILESLVYNAQRLRRLVQMGPSYSLVREYWVDNAGGDDRNEGSQDWPFKSLSRALDHVPTGGHVTIRLIARPDEYSLSKDHRIKHALVEIQTGGVVAGDWGNYAEMKGVSYDGANCYIITGDGLFLQLSNLKITTPHLIPAPDPIVGSLFRVKPLSSMFVNMFWCDIALSNTHLMRGGTGASAYLSGTSCRVDRVSTALGEAILLNAQSNNAICQLAQTTFVDGGTEADYVSGVTLAADGEPRNVMANFSF